MNKNISLKDYGILSVEASRELSTTNGDAKNAALNDLINDLNEKKSEILDKNNIDIENAKKLNLDFHIIERLTLNEKRISEMGDSIKKIIQLPEPVGEVIETKHLPNGLNLEKVRVPLGVIGVIYESRPNVTTDISSICIKSGNSVILRGGKESLNTNIELVKIIRNSLKKNEIAINSVQLVNNPDRSLIKQMLHMNEFIDLMIPRGGTNLVNFVSKNAKMNSITGGIGVCHIYVDKDADLEKALNFVTNAKVQRSTVCNAIDTVIVHEEIASSFIPDFIKKMSEYNVEIRADKKTFAYFETNQENIIQANNKDFGQEFLDLIVSVKIVDSFDKALKHIEKYGTGHSEAIITEKESTGEKFLSVVDASAVFLNASTRYNDGGEFGFGGEVAISTNKFHARGPMGIKELMIYKWKIRGNGHIRE